MMANYSKRTEATAVTIGGNHFHIFPFPAFKAANLSGELVAVVAPMIASIAPLLGDGKGVSNMEIEKAAPEIGAAFNSLSGDKVEVLLKKLLIAYQNISVTLEGNDAQWLTEDLVNELFCGNAQDMFVLAFHVIKVNYSGFFGKFSSQFGKVEDMLLTKEKTSADLENSTQVISVI